MWLGIIMAGGAGERFWPYSRRSLPKQLLALASDKPLLLEAMERVRPVIPAEKVYIVAGEHLKPAIQKALPELPAANILVEPQPQNTAPCLALAVGATSRLFGDPTIAVLTADHQITADEKFRRNLETALHYAEANPALVTIGIPATYPDTGYGYLHAGKLLAQSGRGRLRKVVSFHEKPDQKTAEKYLQRGNFFWNSGMFCWRNSTFMNAARHFAPELAQAAEQISKAWGSPKQDETVRAVFAALPKTSIDFALMEKADNVVLVEGEFGWQDVGTWRSLERILQAAAGDNATVGNCLTVDSRNAIIFNKPVFASQREPIIVTLGIENLIIVNTGDAILVCHKDRTQDIRQLLETLRQKGWGEYL